MTPDNCTIGESTAILVFDIMRDPDAILDRPVTVEFFTDSGTASGTQKHWFGLLYVVCVCVEEVFHIHLFELVCIKYFNFQILVILNILLKS